MKLTRCINAGARLDAICFEVIDDIGHIRELHIPPDVFRDMVNEAILAGAITTEEIKIDLRRSARGGTIVR